MTEAELLVKLEEEVKSLTSYLDPIDYQNAIADAQRETGFVLPNANATEILWLKVRAKRFIFFYLMTESAHKFKVKQYSLHQRFEHYRDIIKLMDQEYKEFLEASAFTPATGFEAFGTKVDAGFQYEPQTGRDTTYRDDNVVIHRPDENA